jgi:phytoene synthase
MIERLFMETHESNDPEWSKYNSDSKRIMAVGSKSFFAASRLFPKRLSTPATIIYAYCRLADDLVDYGGGVEAVKELNNRLDAIYEGKPKNLGVDKDFADVVKKFQIPKEYPQALIDGFLWDVEEKKYENIDQLCDYAARVAGSVGAMIAFVMKVRDPSVIARACELGVAMQLTNIARDVGEDATNSRLYLPRDWLKKEGIDPDLWLKKPFHSNSIKKVIKKLLKTADIYYQRSDEAIKVLPGDCRRAIFAARFIYADIGFKIKQLNYNSIKKRAVVSLSRKIFLIFKSYWKSFIPGFLYVSKPLNIKALNAIVFLVEPAKNLSKYHRCSTRPLGFFQRINWVIELLLKLEARDRYQLAHPRHPPR